MSDPKPKVAEQATGAAGAAPASTVLTDDQGALPVPHDTQAGHAHAGGAFALGDDAGTHGAHPTDAQYIKIALILAVITGVEVVVSYIHGIGAAGPPLLIILAVLKFAMVGAYFMHLKFDNRVLRRLFMTGITLAIAVYIVVFLLLGVFTNTHGAHA